MGCVKPEASSGNIPPVFSEWMTNDNMKGKTGSRRRKQKPEWPTGEERGREKKRGDAEESHSIRGEREK